MTPETAQFLAKAQKLLREAEAMLDINLNDAAGRTAYLSGFHAAQAFISQKTGRTVRTHKGVHTEFQRLTKDDPSFAPISELSCPTLTTSKPLPITKPAMALRL